MLVLLLWAFGTLSNGQFVFIILAGAGGWLAA